MSDVVYRERQALTRSPSPPAAVSNPPIAVPTVNADGGTPVAGDGIDPTGMTALIVTVLANSGATLSGGGNMRCWVNNPEGIWCYMPEFDLSLDWLGGSVQRGRCWAAASALLQLGWRTLYLSDSVTASGGTVDILVRIEGCRRAL